MATVPTNSIHPKTLKAWRQWLEKHYAQDEGIWLISYKKGTGKQAFDYEAAVEQAMCFGWVDSKPGKLDEERTMLYFAPRKPKSGWSKPNKDRIERMIASGQMHASGLAKVNAAKKDGSWTSLDAVEALETPPDLQAALDALPPAAEHFAAFPRSAKRGILEWISLAKQAATRAARIEQTATLAQHNERANQWKPKT